MLSARKILRAGYLIERPVVHIRRPPVLPRFKPFPPPSVYDVDISLSPTSANCPTEKDTVINYSIKSKYNAPIILIIDVSGTEHGSGFWRIKLDGVSQDHKTITLAAYETKTGTITLNPPFVYYGEETPGTTDILPFHVSDENTIIDKKAYCYLTVVSS